MDDREGDSLKPLWELRPDGELCSPRFGDRFYTGSGTEESRAVFIEGNHLQRRWGELRGGADFTIVEIGFGMGLNFALAAELWSRLQVRGRLCYCGVEGFPMERELLQKVHQNWVEELLPWSSFLLEQWPNGVSWSRGECRIELRLLTATVAEALLQLPAQVDCWFLDGFAPEKNRAAWSAELFREIGQRTVIGGTVATFTVAGEIRRRLQAEGFAVKKEVGFEKKRHRLEALKQHHWSLKEREERWENLLVEAFQQALSKGDLAAAEELLGEGVKPSAELLHLALRHGELAMLARLLKAGGDCNCLNSKGVPLLIEAVRRGDLSAEKLLLQQGASEELCDAKGRDAHQWRKLRQRGE